MKLTDIKSDVAISCKTEEECDILCKHVKEQLGLHLIDGYFIFCRHDDAVYFIECDENGVVHDAGYADMEFVEKERAEGNKDWQVINFTDLEF